MALAIDNPQALDEAFATRASRFFRDVPDRNEAQRSFLAYFLRTARDERGLPVRNDHITRILCELAQTCYRQGVHLSTVGPPGYGKSTIARHFSCWALGNDHLISVAHVSAAEETAKRNCSTCRGIIVSDGYKQVFPNIEPDNEKTAEKMADLKGWRLDEFYLRGRGEVNDPAMEAVTAIPKSQARRIHIGLFDDFMTKVIAESPDQRRKHNSHLYQTWIDGRLSNFGWAWLMQNCWHKEDSAHKVLTDERFCSIWIGVTAELHTWFVRLWRPPATLSLLHDPEASHAEPITPHDGADYEFLIPPPDNPKLYDPERLRKMPTRDFRQIYRLIALSEDDLMFPAWTKRRQPAEYVRDLAGVKELGGKLFPDSEARRRIICALGMDIASEKRRGDAIVLIGKDSSTGLIFPLEIYFGTYQIEQVIEIVDDIWTRGWKFGLFNVENNAVQDKYISAITTIARSGASRAGRDWSYRMKGFQTGKNKADSSHGLPGLNIELESGKFVWPAMESSRTDVAHAETWRVAEAHFADCPVFPKPNETPDICMATWFARRALDEITIDGGSLETLDVTFNVEPEVRDAF